jgi:hypothetical protein
MRTFTSLVLGLGVALFGSIGAANAAGFQRAATNPTDFHKIIGEFQQFARNEREALDLSELGARTLDPTKLKLTYSQDIDIYFINEGAGYRNQLGVTSTGTTNLNQIVFPDITCTSPQCLYTGYRAPSNKFGTPDNKPLQIGDYSLVTS